MAVAEVVLEYKGLAGICTPLFVAVWSVKRNISVVFKYMPVTFGVAIVVLKVLAVYCVYDV